MVLMHTVQILVLLRLCDYEADLIVDQLDRDETVLKRYNFRGCFPTSVSAIDLAYGTNDEIERFK